MKRCLGLGVLLIVVVGSAWAQLSLGSLPKLPEPASDDEKAVKFQVKDTPLPEALRLLSKSTGYLFLCEPALEETKVALEMEGKPLEILFRLGRETTAYPFPAIAFCLEDEKPTKEPKFELPDSEVTAEFSELDTPVALELIGTAARTKLVATKKVLEAHPKLSAKLDKAPLEEAVEKLATSLKAMHVRAVYLCKIDPDALFQQFLRLSPQEQEKILLEQTRRMSQSNLSSEQIDRAIDRGLNSLWERPKSERQQIIARVADRVSRLAEAIRRFSPEARAELARAWKPIIQRGLGRFLSLPAGKQAELSPIIDALRGLPF